MTRAELVELLVVERHLPLPSRPKEPAPVYDDSEDVVKARCDALIDAVHASEKKPAEARRHSTRTRVTGQFVAARVAAANDIPPRFVRRGAILVAVKEVAA